MSDKYPVGMAHQVCPVCGDKHDEVVLLDKHLRNKFEPQSVAVGISLCPLHRQQIDDGFVILVEVDEGKSTLTLDSQGNSVLKPENAYRTGNIISLRRTTYEQLLGAIPNEFVYIDHQTFNWLRKLSEN